MPKLEVVNANNVIEYSPQKANFKLKNTGGPKGEPGAQGPQGPKGDTGAQGPAGASASVTVGSTTTLSPGADATVTNSGDTRNAILNFGIPTGARGPKGDTGSKGDTGPMGPKGAKGDTGAAATVQVGNTNTGAPGTNAQVTNAGNEHFAVFNFTIPRGDKGEKGATGAQGPKGDKGDKGDAGTAATITVGSTTTTNPGTNATVTNSGTTSAAVLNFGIPRGATGSVKSEVVAELPETGEGDTFYLVNREATEQTATGKAINFTNSDNAGDITDFKLDGETSQNGTPTPDAPVAVQTVTGENAVKIEGKNLLDVGFTSSTANGVTKTLNADGSITLNGHTTAAHGLYNISPLINFQAGKTYTLSVKVLSGSFTPYQSNTNFACVVTVGRDGSTNFGVNVTGSTSATYTFQSQNSQVPYIWFNWTNNTTSTDAVFNNFTFWIQVEEGSTATTYEPYQEQSYPISLGSIELCKIGTYQDYIYKSGGKWYVHKAINKTTLTGSEYWGSDAVGRYYTNTILDYAGSNNIPFSSHFVGYTNVSGMGNVPVRTVAFNQDNATPRFYIGRYEIWADADALKTWLNSNLPTVYYALATPTDTEITNEALITQLDNVASAPLYTGVNNITTITPNEQGTLEIKYVTYDKYNQNKVYIWNDTLQQWQIIVP